MIYICLTTLAWLVMWTVLGIMVEKKVVSNEDALHFGVGLMLLVFVGLAIGQALSYLTLLG